MPVKNAATSTKEKLNSSYYQPKIEKLNDLIIEAMLIEVGCTPKPGLVDRSNSGSHHDMNYDTFVKSTYSLETTFKKCIFAGFKHDKQLSKLFPQLQKIGLEGEKKMYKATGGINTQKGLIFSMVIIAAAGGYALRRKLSLKKDNLISLIKKLTKGLVARNFLNVRKKDASELTAGEKALLKYEITGIRGEVEAGFPSVLNISLPILNKFIQKGFVFNDALLGSLLALMTHLKDTTIISRGGIDSLNWMHNYSAAIYKIYSSEDCQNRSNLLREMDRVFVDKNLSPGGCADLLAVTVLFYRLEEQKL